VSLGDEEHTPLALLAVARRRCRRRRSLLAAAYLPAVAGTLPPHSCSQRAQIGCLLPSKAPLR
jgi:hypothetical protein